MLLNCTDKYWAIERFQKIYLVFETFDDTCVFCLYKTSDLTLNNYFN